MIERTEVNRIIGADVYGTGGDKIGTAGQVYLDNRTGDPEWITVRTGLFGTKESFVPLAEARFGDDRIDVPFDKNTVKGAPQIDADGDLSPAEEQELYFYYGKRPTDDDGRRSAFSGESDSDRDTGRDRTDQAATDLDRSGREASGPDTTRRDTSDQDVSGRGGDDAMTRSEERLNVDTRTEQTGRARLRKYVVTEQQQMTVPVSREEVRLEREPVTDANRDAAYAGPDLTESEHEVTLRTERPVVDKETVPVERVRLGKQTVTDEETVRGEVRKEQVELDDSDVDNADVDGNDVQARRR